MEPGDSKQTLAPFPWQMDQWNLLLARHRQNRLPHAVMLAGPAGTGKAQFAMALAKAMLCQEPEAGGACGYCKSCALMASGSHPDFLSVEPEGEGKPIKIDQVRGLVDLVGKRSQFEGLKVVFLAPAETMNINAANALLKSLEEPGADTLLVLVSHQTAGVLPTIRSRCQTIEFAMPPLSHCLPWLESVIGDGEKPGLLLNVAGGAPLQALKLNNSEWLSVRSTLFQQWAGVLAGKQDPVKTAESWMEYPLTDLSLWLMTWHVDLCKVLAGAEARVINQDLMPGYRELSSLCNGDQSFYCYRKLQSMRALLLSQNNPNPQLLLEEWLIACSRPQSGYLQA